ncbi:hypothetical protein DPEC_G00125340 [Dallia pectoralis]|uniref:Uncharacterized protein n=1 Tax=Dallia pectoralis TaxID=75939 RepID=A0ACC2GRV7_DALPE|nr:hypothetical protein DPEC_G00125340 [Dallia pectoralis]
MAKIPTRDWRAGDDQSVRAPRHDRLHVLGEWQSRSPGHKHTASNVVESEHSAGTENPAPRHHAASLPTPTTRLEPGEMTGRIRGDCGMPVTSYAFFLGSCLSWAWAVLKRTPLPIGYPDNVL